MQFIEQKLNLIQSEEGWSVKVIPRRSGIIKYIEGNKYIDVDSEMLTSQYDMVLYVDSIKFWRDGLQEIAINESEQKKIIINIISALEFKGYKAEIFRAKS